MAEVTKQTENERLLQVYLSTESNRVPYSKLYNNAAHAATKN